EREREREMMDRTKMNAMRIGLIVIGALAFGYLTLQLGFKPLLENAQVAAAEASTSSSQDRAALRNK
ncbi:hypothetical protein ACJRO7_027576, partial [Eucalyptus globulus]